MCNNPIYNTEKPT